MPIHTKRIYDPFKKEDGYRILVDRLWPRGIKKENAHIDHWLKEIAPSTELRKWIHADPKRWSLFRTKYRAELRQNPALSALRTELIKHKTVTLLFAVRDEEHNHAMLLKEFVEEK